MNDQFNEYISEELGIKNLTKISSETLSNECEFEIEDNNININENIDDFLYEKENENKELKENLENEKNKISNKKKVRNKQKKYQILPLSRKREILLQVEQTKNNLKEIAKINNVKTKTLQRWIKKGPERKRGGGRKIRDPKMDSALYAWYIDYHFTLGKKVNVKLFKNKAMELSNNEHFRASKGWLEKYKKRYNISFN